MADEPALSTDSRHADGDAASSTTGGSGERAAQPFGDSSNVVAPDAVKMPVVG
jgi:hypothetical protein